MTIAQLDVREDCSGLCQAVERCEGWEASGAGAEKVLPTVRCDSQSVTRRRKLKVLLSECGMLSDGLSNGCEMRSRPNDSRDDLCAGWWICLGRGWVALVDEMSEDQVELPVREMG